MSTVTASDTTMVDVFKDRQVRHLRDLLLEDLHKHAQKLAKAAHDATATHEMMGVGSEDARCVWVLSGLQETVAMLDDIGWSAEGAK